MEDAEMMMRRKRWVGGGVSSEPDILTFVSEGGVDNFYDALPGLLPPFLVRTWISFFFLYFFYVSPWPVAL